jgi:hypothetical protein
VAILSGLQKQQKKELLFKLPHLATFVFLSSFFKVSKKYKHTKRALRGLPKLNSDFKIA